MVDPETEEVFKSFQIDGSDDEIIGHLKQQLEFDDQSPMVYNDLGLTYKHSY